jgi:hypothetical protein
MRVISKECWLSESLGRPSLELSMEIIIGENTKSDEGVI